MNILVAGASGGIGRVFCHYLNFNKHNVFTLTRNRTKTKDIIPFAEEHYQWDENWFVNLDKFDAIINLTGASIGKRWTKTYKKEIYLSRVERTKEIVRHLNSFKNKSITLFNASAIGFYPSLGSEIITEEISPGNNFLSKVCRDWEHEALSLKNPHRIIIGRFGIVIKKDDIALQRILMSYKFGFGVVIGNGQQWISWIHIEDLMNILGIVLQNEKFNGIYNFVSPNPIQYIEWIRTIGKILNKPFLLSIPDYLVKLAFGEQSSVLLSSQRVIPKRLIESGIVFKFPEIEGAMKSLLT